MSNDLPPTATERLANCVADLDRENGRLRAALEYVRSIAADELGDWLAVQVPYLPVPFHGYKSIFDYADTALTPAADSAAEPVTGRTVLGLSAARAGDQVTS